MARAACLTLLATCAATGAVQAAAKAPPPLEGVAPGAEPPGLEIAQTRGDADNDKVEDVLAARIAASPAGAVFDVIVVFEGPGAVGRSHAAAGPFAITQEFTTINGYQATLSAAQIRGLAQAPGLFRISGVSEVEAHDIPSNDDMGATDARLDFGRDGSGVTVCVIDTGINASHEQFNTKGLGSGTFFNSINSQTTPFDDHGHGTHVAGIALGDGTGPSAYAADGVGVAPGASLVVAKVLNGSGQGTDPQVLAGIDWCAARGDVDILSMSLGGPPTDGADAMSLAVNCVADPSGATCSGANAPKIVVVSAGNSGATPSTVGAPGVAERAITVGSAADWSGDPADVWQDDGVYLNYFSSRGPVVDGSGNVVRTKPDIVGPGSKVHSAAIGNANLAPYGSAPNYYATLSGTSMSAPFVSGVIALMLEANPSLGVADGNGLPHQKVRSILVSTAIDRGAPGLDNEYGNGLIDAYAAVAEAEQVAGYQPTLFPGYTRLSGETVANFGTWTYEFTVTPEMVGLPLSGVMTSEGAVTVGCIRFFNMCINVEYWSPDLELVLERESSPNNWVQAAAGSGEVTLSTCPSGGECGPYGRTEIVHFIPQSQGDYRFRLYTSNDEPNNGDGGTFDFEISMGPPGSAGGNLPPVAAYTNGCTDLVCTFADTSTDADGTVVSWSWDFGGAGTADLTDPRNPIFTYDASGTYSVTLTVMDDQGAADSQTNLVTARAPGEQNMPPVAGFGHVTSDLTASFTDTSTDSDGSIVSWAWDFGDGNTSTARNPSHTYAAGGSYSVTLTVTDNEGATDTDTQSVMVTDPPPNANPVASFTVDRNPCGTDFFQNTCQFTDTSTDSDGTVVSWQWDFDGGNASGLPIESGHQMLVTWSGDKDPVTVTLTVTDDDGATHTTSMTLPLYPGGTNDPPTAGFTVATDALTANFTDTSSDTDGTIASWSWDFGDGNSATTQSPSHTYAAAGTFTATLTVTDDDGATNTTSQQVTVAEANLGPTAGFTFTIAPMSASFTDTSTDPDGSIASWSWDFGDGTTASVQHPSHTYAAVGTYTVTLTVTDEDGATGSTSRSVSVAPNQSPVAAFSVQDGPNPCGGVVENRCTFTDTSSDVDGTIQSWTWDLGSGTMAGCLPCDGSGQSILVDFPANGPNPTTVSLSVTDANGATDVTSVQVFLSAPAPNTPPTAGFTFSTNALTANFTDTSSDSDGSVASWSWDFGDGNGSAAQSPSHTYAAGGTYTVALTVTDDDGATNTTSQQVTVAEANLAPTAGFNFTIAPLSASFSDTSTDTDGSIVGWSWNFGDGNGATVQNPSHGYATAGTYTVTLTVTDEDGATGSVSQQVSVAPNQAPVAAFSVQDGPNPCGGVLDNRCTFTDISSDSDSAIQTWTWDFGSGTVAGCNPCDGPGQSLLVDFPADGPNPTTVSLTVTDAYGAADVTSVQVFLSAPAVNAPPTAGFTVSTADLTASFTDTSGDSDGSIGSWSWNFGDGNGSSAQNPSHAYTAGGTYTATLTVTDNDGATDSASQSVTVTEPPLPVHIGDLDDASALASRGRWEAIVSVRVLDGGGSAVPGATVGGSWSGGATGGGSCTTGAGGTCSISKPNLKSNVSSATFTVSSITGANLVYVPGANADPDGDSTGTAIVVVQPGGTANQPPSVAISAPSEGASFSVGASVQFTGSASDAEDGSLTSSLSWSSSIDGTIGSGASFSTSGLSAGTHTIMAAFVDSGGSSGADTISITVGSPTPPEVILSAVGYKVKGEQFVDLTWSGAAGADVAILRNGAIVATTANDGSQTHATGLKGGAIYTFQICETGEGACSNTVQVVF